MLLKWTIGLVPERSTRVMAFTIIVHNFYLSAYRHVCKSDQVYLILNTIHQGFWQLPLQKPVSQLNDFVMPVPKKGSPKKRIFGYFCKEAKKIYQPGFKRVCSRKGYQKLHTLAPCYCWRAENCWWNGHCWVYIQTKWKNSPWTCNQNLANGVSQRKTGNQQSILNRYSEDTFDFWLY